MRMAAIYARVSSEQQRDLAAEGHIQVVLAYAPDRLSRKYAFQILLIEELVRHGVEALFVKAPQGDSAEDQLLVQFQGMIAEYERAQILERSRRGKRHRAQTGEISVLSGAPYGYRYIRKTDEAAAAYSVHEPEARVVQRIYEMHTAQGLSIGDVTRRLNAEGIPTRKESACWERSTVWAVLHNRLSWRRPFRQDARRCTEPRDAPTASEGVLILMSGPRHRCQPIEVCRRVTRIPGWIPNSACRTGLFFFAQFFAHNTQRSVTIPHTSSQ
jgi:DNA invertase Pin-like site-specific DNA recombinase